MRSILIYAAILISGISCSKKNKIPEGVLKPEKMQVVLTDILIAEAYNSDRSIKDSSVKLPQENASAFLRVFQLHNITRNEFNRSYSFYLKRPDLFKVITDSISAVIYRRNAELITLTDSIKSKPKLNGNNLKKVTGEHGR